MGVNDWTEAVTRDGFAVVPDVADGGTVERLIAGLEAAADSDGARRSGGLYAIRNLLQAVPEAGALARSAALRALVAPVLGAGAFPVRGILFDKTAGANWNVIWHQDLSIAVRERRDVPGFGPWSEKAGVTHVQPPASVLARMLTVRLHLDDCDADNCPLRVLPGSHRAGRLDAAAIQEWHGRGRAADAAPAAPRVVGRADAWPSPRRPLGLRRRVTAGRAALVRARGAMIMLAAVMV